MALAAGIEIPDISLMKIYEPGQENYIQIPDREVVKLSSFRGKPTVVEIISYSVDHPTEVQKVRTYNELLKQPEGEKVSVVIFCNVNQDWKLYMVGKQGNLDITLYSASTDEIAKLEPQYSLGGKLMGAGYVVDSEGVIVQEKGLLALKLFNKALEIA